MTTEVENLHTITDAEGNVIAFYEETADSLDVKDANGNVIGYIDENYNICADDAVVASLNAEFAVEDEDEANALYALSTGEEVEEATTEVAQYAADEDAAEAEGYEDEDAEVVTLEEIDAVLQLLYKRGLPVEDIIEYPKNVVDMDNPPEHVIEGMDEDGDFIFKQEFIETEEYGYSLYRRMLDQIMDILAPRLVNEDYEWVYDENGMAVRSFENLIGSEGNSVYTFDQDSMRALREVVERAKKNKDIGLDVEGLMDTLEGLKDAMVDEDKGVMARMARLADKVDVKKWGEYVKENPGKAATVGAATAGGFIVAGPIGAAAAGGATAGGGRFLSRFRKKDEDPDILEMQALRKQLELFEKQAPAAYDKLDESIETIDLLRQQNEDMKEATIVTHRRVCAFISAGEAVLAIMDSQIVPTAEKDMTDNPNVYSYERRYEDTLEARNTLNSHLENMNAGLAEGKIDIAAGNTWAKTLKLLKQKMSAHKASRPRLDMQILRAKRALETTDMAELTVLLDRLRDSALEINTEMGEKTAGIAIKASSRTVTSIESLNKAAQTQGSTHMRLESASKSNRTAKDRRNLLESVSSATSGGKAGSRRRLISSGSEAPKKPSSGKPRKSLADVANKAANGDVPQDKKSAAQNKPAAPKKPTAPKKP